MRVGGSPIENKFINPLTHLVRELEKWFKVFSLAFVDYSLRGYHKGDAIAIMNKVSVNFRTVVHMFGTNHHIS